MSKLHKFRSEAALTKMRKHFYHAGGPSRRPVQGSNMVKCFKYAKGHYCENLYQIYSAKNARSD